MSADEIRSSTRQELRAANGSPAPPDAVEKVTGTTRFAGDFAFSDMLHARLVRSQVPSARIVRRDASRALEIPGVIAVLFGEDVPNNVVWVDVPGQTIEVAALKASMEVLVTAPRLCTIRATSSPSGTSTGGTSIGRSRRPTSSWRASTPRSS